MKDIDRNPPQSSSKYSLHLCYSNALGAHGAPRSCVDKMRYDWDLGGAPNTSRVMFTHVSADPIHANYLKNPLRIARACKKRARRQKSCRQMAHITVALPFELSDAAQMQLCVNICEEIRTLRDGVPVFAAMHRPKAGSKNFHVHISHPLWNLVRSVSGSWILGERITVEQRPKQRALAGLPKTAHDDIRRLRASVAERIAEALSAEKVNPHIVERWRHGHERLSRQVALAAQRGDVEFVRDHALREPSSHQWPTGNRSRIRIATHGETRAPNTQKSACDLQVISHLLDHIVTLARALRIRRPALLRILAIENDVISRPRNIYNLLI